MEIPWIPSELERRTQLESLQQHLSSYQISITDSETLLSLTKGLD